MTPEEKLASVRSAVEAAGGKVTSVQPLADESDVNVIVAHRVSASSPDRAVAQAVNQVLEQNEVATVGLVPWVDPDAPDPEDYGEGIL